MRLLFAAGVLVTAYGSRFVFLRINEKRLRLSKRWPVDHLGDFNARIGCESDYIEGVDDVKPREVIIGTLNSYGDHLLDFLINCNLCILNGRLGIQYFTNVSKRGRSLIDYVCVPHEQFAHYSEFSVHTMTSSSLNHSLSPFWPHSVLSQFSLVSLNTFSPLTS